MMVKKERMDVMTYEIRNARPEDLPRIEEVYAQARQFMAANGNPSQWGDSYPPRQWLVDDIAQGNLFVVTDAGGIHGVFFFFIGPDETYARIEDGHWSSDKPYGTIHRIASDGSGGIFRAAVEFCQKQIDHLRMDTHHDNLVMQNAAQRMGFQPCGIIYVSDGTARIAYEKCK